MSLPPFLKRLFSGPADAATARERFLQKYGAYRNLVAANNRALERLADMQAKATGEFLFDAKYLEDSRRKILEDGRAVVEALESLTGRREKALRELLGRLERETGAALQAEAAVPEGPPTLPFLQVAEAPVELVGAKASRLAALRTAGVPAPDGFSVTSRACRDFLEAGGLLPRVLSTLETLSLSDRKALEEASRRLRSEVTATPCPEPLAEAIRRAFDDLEERTGRENLLVSVRSSAVGEDGEFSFAGQYATVLNVGREGLLDACREVVASAFGPRALVYYKARGEGFSLLPMAVCVVEMVDARASGVLYTRDPQRPDAEEMVVSGTWGLGPSTVDGRVTPDSFTVSREPPHAVVASRTAFKERMLLCREDVGLVETEVPGWMRSQPCLTPGQLAQLAAAGLALERRFGRPQDVEWALDERERILILQSRPLRLHAGARPEEEVVALRKDLRPLLSAGAIACRGVAAGPVFPVLPSTPLSEVPPGAVVVARAAEPRLAEVIDRAAALVAEVGSTTSHLATVAREFNVPALFGAAGALERLPAGRVVTVDAEMGQVFEGRQEALLESAERRRQAEAADNPMVRRLKEVLAHLAPLNLTDVRARNFRPRGCQTLHDLLRYAHERAIEEMFLAGGSFGRAERAALRLESPLPVAFYFIDLGGGLELPPGERRLRPEHFRCRPLKALWPGMVEVPWDAAPAASGRAVASLLLTGLTSAEAQRSAAEPNYVLVSEAYLNMNFRLGYHFSRVDANATANPHENYASFLFHGGAADEAGRSRRIDFLERVLGGEGWRTARRRDALFARLDHLDAETMDHRLRVLGRLLVVTRQIDTLLGGEDAVAKAAEAFARQDYSLGLGEAPP